MLKTINKQHKTQNNFSNVDPIEKHYSLLYHIKILSNQNKNHFSKLLSNILGTLTDGFRHIERDLDIHKETQPTSHTNKSRTKRVNELGK